MLLPSRLKASWIGKTSFETALTRSSHKCWNEVEFHLEHVPFEELGSLWLADEDENGPTLKKVFALRRHLLYLRSAHTIKLAFNSHCRE